METLGKRKLSVSFNQSNTIVQEGRNRDDNTKNFSLAGDNQSQAAAAHWM